MTAIDSTSSPTSITVSPSPASLAAVVQSAQVNYSGPLGDSSPGAQLSTRVMIPGDAQAGSAGQA